MSRSLTKHDACVTPRLPSVTALPALSRASFVARKLITEAVTDKPVSDQLIATIAREIITRT